MLSNPFRPRVRYEWKPAPYVAPTIPTPPGWRIARTMGDVTCYEVRRRLPLVSGPRPIAYLSGTNDREYYGFPAGTLNIGGLIFEPPPIGQVIGGHIVFRLDYRPAGWRFPNAPPLPACDYGDLPGDESN